MGPQNPMPKKGEGTCLSLSLQGEAVPAITNTDKGDMKKWDLHVCEIAGGKPIQ